MLVTMSDKEIHRLPVIQAVCEKRLRRRDAASQLGISERQAQRLINRYRVSGAEGLVSRKRGQPSNSRLTESLKMRVLTLVLRLAQVKQDERESEGKRERSKKSPSRKAQVRVQEQLRAINPVLADPSLFVASSKR